MPFDPPASDLRFAGVSMPDVALRSSPNLLTGLRRGICRTCPACGQGRLFGGYLAVLLVCAVCGNDNEQYPSDDFAPYVTIFLVLHLMVSLLFLADRTWAMSALFEVGLAIPIFLLATLALLPFVKGGVIGFAWAVGVTRNPTANCQAVVVRRRQSLRYADRRRCKRLKKPLATLLPGVDLDPARQE